MKKHRAALATAIALLVLTACTGSRTVGTGAGGSPAADAGAVSDGGLDGGAPQVDGGRDAGTFEHQVYRHEISEGRTGVATGDFFRPSVRYDPIPVDPKFTHVLTFDMSPFLPPHLGNAPTSGPLIVYADDLDTIVFSPLDHFFTSLVSFENGAIESGVEGEVAEIPAGFVHRFISVRGAGIRATIDRWGDLLRADRGRGRTDRYADLGLSTVGYWTDNGAAYYYATEGAMNYADTLLAVKADADARKIPFGYLQLDSWWYYKAGSGGVLGGLTRWEPMPDVFPDGLAAFRDRVGLPFVAHNRWFAKDNAYKDRYPFTDGDTMSLPLTSGPYDEFMANAVEWGIFTYEQDWLMNQFQGVPYLRTGIGDAERWMGDMTGAAAARGLTMQLCMPGAAHLMDSIDRPAITTSRTSTDYHENVCKECFWPQFHTVNMLAWALGIVPFKDNFQSSEAHAEPEALVSALSAGMVGVSDRIGAADRALILRTCRADGVLLKPDRPAYPLDGMFLPHRRPYLTATESRNAAGVWTYLAAYHLASGHPEHTAEDENYALFAYSGEPVDGMFVYPRRVSDWRVDPAAEIGITGKTARYDWRTGTAAIVEGPFGIPTIEHLYDYAYYVFAPILDNGLALIGESDKYVTMADRRFSGIEVFSDGVRVTLAGAPGETVTIRAFDARSNEMLPDVSVTIGPDGVATAAVTR